MPIPWTLQQAPRLSFTLRAHKLSFKPLNSLLVSLISSPYRTSTFTLSTQLESKDIIISILTNLQTTAKMPNWKTYESSVRLLSAIVAAHPGLKLNYDGMLWHLIFTQLNTVSAISAVTFGPAFLWYGINSDRTKMLGSTSVVESNTRPSGMAWSTSKRMQSCSKMLLKKASIRLMLSSRARQKKVVLAIAYCFSLRVITAWTQFLTFLDCDHLWFRKEVAKFYDADVKYTGIWERMRKINRHAESLKEAVKKGVDPKTVPFDESSRQEEKKAKGSECHSLSFISLISSTYHILFCHHSQCIDWVLDLALRFGGDCTSSALENRFRRIRSDAKLINEAVTSGVDPITINIGDTNGTVAVGKKSCMEFHCALQHTTRFPSTLARYQLRQILIQF